MILLAVIGLGRSMVLRLYIPPGVIMYACLLFAIWL